MKKVLKVLLYIIIVIILGVLGFVAYIYFSKSENRDPFSIIPDDSIYIIETRNLNQGWEQLSKSKFWTHLMGNEYFSDVNAQAMYFDTLMTQNSIVESLLKDRQLIISSHLISGVDYDFIFIVDVQKASKVSFLSDAIGLFDYNVNKRDYNNIEIIELTDLASNETLYLTIIDNLLAGSYTASLIENLIDQKDKNHWKSDNKFIDASNLIKGNELFKFYFNYGMLSKYMKIYLDEDSEELDKLSQAMAYSMFSINFENELLTFDGYTNFFDSIPSYINALGQVDPGKISAHKVLPNKSALYLSLSFSDFNKFYNNIIQQFANEDSSEYANIEKNIERAEKFLKIDLDEVFFSWIGQEIAFAKMQPESNAKEEDVVIAIHTKNIEDAKKGMDALTNQVRKRSPVKFEIVEHEGFEINYLNMKGFFKLFLGKMFGKIQKPYYTFIEDFVVFSNSPSSLMDLIDEYNKGNILVNNDEFMSFKENLDEKANISIFIQMPKIYQHLFFYSDKDTKKSVQENRELILSFAKIGFQMKSKSGKFITQLVALHDENALMYEELEKMEKSAEDISIDIFDTLGFKPIIPESYLKTEQLIQYYYVDSLEPEDSVIIYEGMVTKGEFDGLWRTFYKSGKLFSSIVYKDGKADGNAMFYYNDKENAPKTEVNFEEDIMNGEYKEFYENGNLKAELNFKDGKLHSDAKYYYNSGKLKIVGKYKNGAKKGKWKFYAETGEQLNKENWKKHKENLE